MDLSNQALPSEGKDDLPRVLAVDDDKPFLDALCALIEEEGYLANGVNSGAEAFKYLEQNPVDLVLTELFMSGVDGWDLLEEIKKKRPHVHVVVTTGHITDQGEALLTSRKADGYLIKPIKPRRLSVLFRALLRPDNLDRATEAVVVDRDPAALSLIEDTLGDRGIQVHPFKDIRRAMYHIEDDPPDLVITEVNLGKENGLALCQDIRSSRDVPYIPILITTADTTRQNVVKAAKLHVNGFLSKPLSSEILGARAMDLLRHTVDKKQKN